MVPGLKLLQESAMDYNVQLVMHATLHAELCERHLCVAATAIASLIRAWQSRRMQQSTKVQDTNDPPVAAACG